MERATPIGLYFKINCGDAESKIREHLYGLKKNIYFYAPKKKRK
jgi:hypothetical protein